MAFNAEGGDTSESETYCTATTTTTVSEVDCYNIVSSALHLLNEQHSILLVVYGILRQPQLQRQRRSVD